MQEGGGVILVSAAFIAVSCNRFSPLVCFMIACLGYEVASQSGYCSRIIIGINPSNVWSYSGHPCKSHSASFELLYVQILAMVWPRKQIFLGSVHVYTTIACCSTYWN